MNDDTTKVNEKEDILPEEEATLPAGDAGALQSEVEELRNKVLYAQADTQNVRRRLEKEVADARAYAATGFARDMLSIADNLARALSSISPELRENEAWKPLLTGIEMTAKELEATFARQGITRIEAMGQPLDPNKHQAIMEMESADKAPGTVVHEMQSGWMIKDRLLRPAMVGVAKAPAGGGVDVEA